MKLRLYTQLLLILLISAIYSGCSKEEYLPGLTGSMVGYLYTFDQFGNLLEDHSQVKITAFGMDQTYTDYSDVNGRFELAEVPTGTYELHFEKNGFGLLKQFGVQHLGGKPTMLPYVDFYEHAYFLYEMPSTTITDLSIENDTIFVQFSFTTVIPPDRMHLRIYYSSNAGFSSSEAEYVELRYLYTAGEYYKRYFHLQDAPFAPGETVYIKACCIAEVGSFHPPMQIYRTIYGVDTYFDYEKNQTIYPASGNESETFSILFPE